jgi:hypothetical protein
MKLRFSLLNVVNLTGGELDMWVFRALLLLGHTVPFALASGSGAPDVGIIFACSGVYWITE